MNDILINHLKEARKRLVDVGARNRLIHVNLQNRRANALNIINERTEDIFDLMRLNGKRMRFLPTGTDDEVKDTEETIELAPNAEEEEFDEQRYRDNKLETPLGPESLQRRILRLYTDARTAEEEQGINILYLAMGFLNWYEDKSSNKTRTAPLILLPVELIRSERGSTFNLKIRDDDIATNLPLQERLSTDFGIKLPEINDSIEWLPSQYFESVTDAISEHPRWSIQPNEMLLGFFSFAKLLMMHDLEIANWSEETLAENGLLNRLLIGGFTAEAPLYSSDEKLDQRLKPADLIHVVDADASQTRVIEEVRANRNLVVQGPPGTGKSQTITNIIASAVHDGKTVLFMAEKMAALSVVHSRLKKVGLSDLCLELHSRKANKREMIEEMKRTLNAGRSVPDLPATPDELQKSRDRLNELAELLHEPLPDRDYTPIEAIGEISLLTGKNVSVPEKKYPILANLTKPQRAECETIIQTLLEILATTGPREEHPFRGVNALELQPPDLQRLDVKLKQFGEHIGKLFEDADQVITQLSIAQLHTYADIKNVQKLINMSDSVPEDANQEFPILFKHKDDQVLGEKLDNGKFWQNEKDSISKTFSNVALSAEIGHLRSKLSRGVGSFLYRIFGGYRGASAEFSTLLNIDLPKSPVDRLKLLDKLITFRQHDEKISQDKDFFSTVFGPTWRVENADFKVLHEKWVWLDAFLNNFPDCNISTIQSLPEIAPRKESLNQDIATEIENSTNALTEIINQLKLENLKDAELDSIDLRSQQKYFANMQSAMSRYKEWSDLARVTKQMNESQFELAEWREAIENGILPPNGVLDIFKFAIAEARWIEARAKRPELDKIDSVDRHQLVKTFCNLEEKRIKDAQTLIRAKHLEQLPTGTVGEMGFLRGEMAKKSRHKPIRKIIEAAGTMVQRTKPVFLMSPISIAQFLPPGKLEFDVLVIDEASQIRPEDALGAVARAKQIVVVGDQKQLPPTSFFDRSIEFDDDHDDDGEFEDQVPATAKATELESILTLSEARGVDSRMLEWHYRSRDPSLIRVSNLEFYENRLILPPSPVQLDDDYGLKFTRVPGEYSSASVGKGRAGTNRIEAEYIVEALKQHYRNWPTFSVGVVAFSKAQSNMITEVLEYNRRTDTQFDQALREGKSEDIFVKNIENVQGDERDVILISVGYGPHEANQRLRSMSFGPINNEGGERRLNVLFTRARIKCEIFSSFEPGDIDISRLKRDGPRVLKKFLEFAKTGNIDDKLPTGEPADSTFEIDVANVIHGLGYHVDHQVGSAGFRIDLGVRPKKKPGKYILAVECDGATYHSALWARERDRLRQAVLENLGWRFHRIWSTDWFYRRQAEIDRLAKALQQAKTDLESEITFQGSNVIQPISIPAESPQEQISEPENIDPVPSMTLPLYQEAQIFAQTQNAPHELSVTEMANLVTQVISQEGPVHFDIIVKRIANAFGKQRAGNRIQTAVNNGLLEARTKTNLLNDGEFWLTPTQARDVPVRNRDLLPNPDNKAEYISPREIRKAASMIEAESGEVEHSELIRAIARLFGYQQTGSKLQSAISDALNKNI